MWVCDFTYIRAGGRFYYLCAILDLFSRKVIAYKLSNKIDTQLAIDTVNLAVAGRGTSEGIIFILTEAVSLLQRSSESI